MIAMGLHRYNGSHLKPVKKPLDKAEQMCEKSTRPFRGTFIVPLSPNALRTRLANPNAKLFFKFPNNTLPDAHWHWDATTNRTPTLSPSRRKWHTGSSVPHLTRRNYMRSPCKPLESPLTTSSRHGGLALPKWKWNGNSGSHNNNPGRTLTHVTMKHTQGQPKTSSTLTTHASPSATSSIGTEELRH